MEVVIPLGSIVVVDLDDRQFIDKKVYCVNFPQAGGDIADVKRVQKWNEGRFILISDNTAKFPPEISHLD
jgi:phage repressor protein C with HTH and peptisase S24 domain